MSFECMFTTDEMREKIFDFLKSEYGSKNDLDICNINWTDGVYDKESGIFLTLIYYVYSFITRCGMEYYSYIVIIDDDIFKVDNNRNYDKGGYYFSIPVKYSDFSDKVKEGIKFYDRNCYGFTMNLSEEKKKELREIERVMFDRCFKIL